MSKEETAETLLDPAKRIIHQISVGDEQEASAMFEKMMGDSVTPRKDFLKKYSEEAIYNME